MAIDHFKKKFSANKKKVALIYDNKKYLYKDLIDSIKDYEESDLFRDCLKGEIIAIESDYNLTSISLIFFLISRRCIVVPIYNKKKHEKDEMLSIVGAKKIICIDSQEKISIENFNRNNKNNLIENLRENSNPGLILFSSGSSGYPKAAVHNFDNLLSKFTTPRPVLITINFLLFDHWGGLNTMLHVLSNGGSLVLLKKRTPEYIANLIEKNSVELLPVSPTFLNLFILSNVHKKYDFSSLKIISYGTEAMPETTLIKLKKIFPNVKLQQTYGLIEVGVLRSKSKDNGSLWFKIGGEGYNVRIKDEMLEIKSKSVMLGYLNAESPFSNDGWYKTGDKVIQKDGFIKILGRASEVINVGGEKVYPQEIENEILKMNNVEDVTIFSEKNALIGNVICAEISLKVIEDRNIFKKKMTEFLKDKISSYKIPIKIIITKDIHHNARFKKKRI